MASTSFPSGSLDKRKTLSLSVLSESFKTIPVMCQFSAGASASGFVKVSEKTSLAEVREMSCTDCYFHRTRKVYREEWGRVCYAYDEMANVEGVVRVRKGRPIIVFRTTKNIDPKEELVPRRTSERTNKRTNEKKVRDKIPPHKYETK